MPDSAHPEKPEEEAFAPRESSIVAVSRRKMLTRSAIVAAAAVPIGVLASQAVNAAAGRPAARTLATQRARPAVAQTAAASGLTAHVAMGFMDIRNDENAHVDALKGVLGSNARPKPTFKALEAGDVISFAKLSRTLENTGVGAYIFGAGAISDKGVLTTAAGILSDEGRHAGWVDNILGMTLAPNGPIDKPLSQSEIVNAVSPFIASLNGGSDPSGKLANDMDILNFALLLEYLESTFYNINVPKFFGTVGQG